MFKIEDRSSKATFNINMQCLNTMKCPQTVTLFPLDFAKKSANIGAMEWDMLLVEVAVAKPVSFNNNYKIDCKVNLEGKTKLASQVINDLHFGGTHL